MDSPPATPNPEQARGVTVEEIVSGTRCSPFTLKEFEGFLIHEEHSVENLQFIVWYRSYCERFKALAPEYQALSDPPMDRYTQYNTPAGSIRTASSMKGKDDTWWQKLITRRFSASIPPPDEEAAIDGLGFGDFGMEERKKNGGAGDDDRQSLRSEGGAPDSPTFVDAAEFPDAGKGKAAPAFNRVMSNIGSDTSSLNSENLDRKSKKFPSLRFANLAPLVSRKSRDLPEDTPLPFLDEIKLITTTFILPGASKELNIDARLRRHILKSLEPTLENGTKGPPATTHPDVFKEAADHTYTLMERSLPHYMQWAKGNINTPKMLFWYGVGTIDFGIGVMLAMLIMYRAHSRWWRIFSFLFIQFGTMQAYSASRYFCSQVHGRTARQLYPWELTTEIESTKTSAPAFVTGDGKKDAAAKQKSDLQASLPFLFDDVDLANGSETEGSTKSTAALTSTPPSKASLFRSKYLGAWRKKDGKRVPIFGPERVIEDPYIKEIHNKQIKEILIVGAVVALLFEIMVVALPEQARSI
ncbi:hypothetical protein RQP46_002882 [Phenoliferia psychrophenolica]